MEINNDDGIVCALYNFSVLFPNHSQMCLLHKPLRKRIKVLFERQCCEIDLKSPLKYLIIEKYSNNCNLPSVVGNIRDYFSCEL